MAMISFGLCVLLAFTLSTTSGAFVKGYCPYPGSVDNFDFDKFKGRWFQVEYFNAFFELQLVCPSIFFSDDEDGNIVVIHGGLREMSFANQYISTRREAVVPNPARQSEFYIFYSDASSGENFTTGPANYFVVDTDYTNYSVIFSCRNLIGPISIQYAWILTRDRNVVPPNLSELKNNLQSRGVDISNFNSAIQVQCEAF